MSLPTPHQFDYESVTDTDDCGTYTPTATSEFGTTDTTECFQSPAYIPSHGSIVTICELSTKNVITFFNGEIVLAPPNGLGIIKWKCVEIDGWIGFQDVASNKFLGYRSNGTLICSASRLAGWEFFTITPMSNGGHIMQMLSENILHPVVRTHGNKSRTLSRAKDKLSRGIVWKFLHAQPETGIDVEGF